MKTKEEPRYTWDKSHRFDNDPCGCRMCRKIQEVVTRRQPLRRLSDYYAYLEIKIA